MKVKTAPEPAPAEAPASADPAAPAIAGAGAPAISDTPVQAAKIFKTLSHSLSSNWAVEEYVARRRREGTLSRSDLIYRALASPNSSIPALLLAIFLMLTAVTSVLLSAVQLSYEASEVAAGRPCPRSDEEQVACDFDASQYVDFFFLAIFGSEILVRFLVYVKPWRDVFVWVDIFCLVPLVLRQWLSLIGKRPFEVDYHLRVPLLLAFALAPLRLLKLARYSSAAIILKRAIIDSSSALWIPFYLLVVLFTFMGGVVFAFEYDPSESMLDGSRVSTVLEAWWMMLVTMVTVGYGDFSPRSETGRVLTAISMCAGLCFTAMPLAIVGNTFSTAWEARSLSLISEKIRGVLLQKGHTSNSLEAAFAEFDLDGNGSIDYNEFKHFLLHVLEVPLDVKKLRKVWRSLDQDDSNIIKYQEFCLAIFPEYDIPPDISTSPPAVQTAEPSAGASSTRRPMAWPSPPKQPPKRLSGDGVQTRIAVHELGRGVGGSPPANRPPSIATRDDADGGDSAPPSGVAPVHGVVRQRSVEARLGLLESAMQGVVDGQRQLDQTMRELLCELRAGGRDTRDAGAGGDGDGAAAVVEPT